MLTTVALKKITQMLNKILSSDPFVLQDFAALSGKTLRVRLLKTPGDFLIHFDASGLALSIYQPEDPVTVMIAGAPLSLLRFARTDAQTKMLMDKTVQITGDVDLLMMIKKIQSRLSIDWEGLFAECVGDFAANRIFMLLKRARKKITGQANLLYRDGMDYIHHEIEVLPTRAAVEMLYEEIRALRVDVDRVALRLKKLR